MNFGDIQEQKFKNKSILKYRIIEEMRFYLEDEMSQELEGKNRSCEQREIL